MKTLFNELPNVSYEVNLEEHKHNLEEGYASPIEMKENITVLCFKDVDDHIDGNGRAVLWLIQGKGSFYYDGDKIELNVGDVIEFNDKLEHGFEADELCLGVNFTLESSHTLNDIKNMVQSFNTNKKKLKI